MRHWLAALLLLLAACTGPVGEQGSPGPPGEQGRPGVWGYDGPPGEQGPRGEPGPQGAQGEPGAQGDKGIAGPRGREGIRGPDGPEGDQGLTGPQGPSGVTGVAVERWLVRFDTQPKEAQICWDGANDIGEMTAPDRVHHVRGLRTYCQTFTAPYPEGTSQAWFEAALVSGYLFQDTEELNDRPSFSGPIAEARRDPMLLLNWNNRAGVEFMSDGIRLVVATRSIADRRDGFNVDDWRVHLTRLGPPAVTP